MDTRKKTHSYKLKYNSDGIGRVMEMALGHIGTDTPIHLSFDVDALDPQWAPSTGTPVRGGLTLREGDYIAECLHETGSLVAMDLVSGSFSFSWLHCLYSPLCLHLYAGRGKSVSRRIRGSRNNTGRLLACEMCAWRYSALRYEFFFKVI